MIEINITTKEAVTYLTARISEEKRLREKAGLLPSETKLTQLTYKEILSLAEAAAFDLVFLLPTDVFVEESNLSEIITKAFNELAKIYGYKEFLSFSIKNANILIKPIKEIIANSKLGDKYEQN
jgi:hypothetical protein